MTNLRQILRRGERLFHRRPPFTVVFIHIPKTGGMSLREVLLREARGRPTFWIVDPVKDTTWLRSIAREERERYVVVEGHMYYGVHELLPRPCVYMTMLRNPVERVLSYYSHMREREDHHLHGVVRDEGLSLAECIRRGLTVELDNFMVRAMTSLRNVGVPFGEVTRGMLEEAKAHLDGVTLLGITERFEESMTRFGEALEWRRGEVPRVNVTGERVRREELNGADLEVVLAANAFDGELYEYAVSVFEARMGGRTVTASRAPCGRRIA